MDESFTHFNQPTTANIIIIYRKENHRFGPICVRNTPNLSLLVSPLLFVLLLRNVFSDVYGLPQKREDLPWERISAAHFLSILNQFREEIIFGFLMGRI